MLTSVFHVEQERELSFAFIDQPWHNVNDPPNLEWKEYYTMPLYLRIGLLTCAFYLGTLFAIEGAKIAVAHLQFGFGFSYNSQRAWFVGDSVFYGLIWLASFSLARYLVWQTLHFPTGPDWHFGG